MKNFVLCGIVCAAGASVAGASVAVAQEVPWFSGIGDLPGGPTVSHLRCLSPDGQFAGGFSRGEQGHAAILWSLDLGLEDIGSPPTDQGYPSAIVTALTGHATAATGVVTTSMDPVATEASIWSSFSGFEVLGDLPGGNAGAWPFEISADARTIVGSGTIENNLSRAWRWTRQTGMVDLGTLPDPLDDYSLASSVSADGSIVAGVSSNATGYEAFSWTAEGGMVGLGDLPGGGFGSGIVDITPDGRILVGYGMVDGNIYEGALWINGGPIESIGGFPGLSTFPIKVSADGKTIVGYVWPTGSTSEAAIWTEEAGWHRLADVLTDDYGLGADVAGWTLQGSRGISDDGRTISGWGINPDGNEEGWVVFLGDRCPGDFNQDGVVNTLDVLAFLNAWTTGCP